MRLWGIDGREALWPLLGAVALCIYLTAVEIAPFLVQVPGTVPSPVQSVNSRVGDFLYYLSNVREFGEADWPPEMPSNAHGQMFEVTRLLPLAIASLPLLITDDIRFVLILGYVLIAIGLSIPSYLICRHLTGNPKVAAALAFLVLCYASVWTTIPLKVDLAGLNLRPALQGATKALIWIAHPYDKFAIGDQFRFLQPSLAIPFGLVFLLLILKLRTAEQLGTRLVLASLLTAVGVALTVTYQPVAVFSYFVLIAAAGAALFMREWTNLVFYVVCGLVILALIAALNIPGFVTRVIEANPLASQLYNPSEFRLALKPAKEVISLVCNKYIFFSVLILVVSLILRTYVFEALLVFFVSVLLTLVHVTFNDPLIAGRLGRRAGDVPWLLLCSGIIAAMALAFVRRSTRPWLAKSIVILAFFGLASIPVWGQSTTVLRAAAARRLPTDDYLMLTRLGESFPQDTQVATLEWRIVDLVGVFTDLDSSVSDIQLTGRTPEMEMDRVMALYKALGYLRADFLTDVRESIAAEKQRTRPYREANQDPAHSTAYWHVPFSSDVQFRRAGLARYVLRYQNLKYFAGLPIQAAPDVISKELLNYLGARWDAAPQCAGWIAEEVDLVMIDRHTSPAATWTCGEVTPVVVEGSLTLYHVGATKP